MLWIKAFHVVFVVTWFAGLFYLPRLFVYHAMTEDAVSLKRFELMERKLFWGIMTPSAVLTMLLGMWMLTHHLAQYMAARWMHVKLGTVVLIVLYHVWCGKLLVDFKHGRNAHSHGWYRWFNELPVAFLIIISVMTIVRPF
jgi:putative membrane protein